MSNCNNYEELGFAKIDVEREARTGFPEVIYAAGKTPAQVRDIFARLISHTDGNVFATRANSAVYEAVKAEIPEAVYFETAQIVAVNRRQSKNEKVIAVCCAGTSDIPVCEEAAVTVELMGGSADRVYDVGVAGLHRLTANIDRIRAAHVVIAVAGMEGALPSVLGGLVSRPVIAVPTSVGYGASFGGAAALLAMLNSCASGVTVVNIDNGFGAAYAAMLMCGVSK